MRISLETLARVASFQHVARKPKKGDTAAVCGIHVEIGASILTVAATNKYVLAKTTLPVFDALSEEDSYEGTLTTTDLVAAAAAFTKRAPKDALGQPRGNVEIEQVSGGGLELILGPDDQLSIFPETDEDDPEPATYHVRLWTSAEYPNWRKIPDGLPARRKAEPVTLDPAFIVAATKTAGPEASVTFELYGTKVPAKLLSTVDEKWAGYIVPIIGYSDTMGEEGTS